MVGQAIREDDPSVRTEHAGALEGLIGDLAEGSWCVAEMTTTS